MNGVTLPQSVIDRVVAKRGAEHVFAHLDPVRTALVVSICRTRSWMKRSVTPYARGARHRAKREPA